MFSRTTPKIICTLAILVAATPLWATDYVSSPAGGNWDAPAAWTADSGFPNAATDNATVGSAVAIDNDFSVGNLTINPTGNLTYAGSYSEALRIHGNLDLGTTTFQINSLSAGSPNGLYFQGASAQTIANGTIQISASTPGAILEIDSSATLTATATLEIDGPLTGTGNSALTNDGAITYTGGANASLAPSSLINNATLSLTGAGPATLSVGNFSNNASVNVASGANLAVDGALGNAGTITSAGAITLAGSNLLSDLGTITGGTVNITGTLTGTPGCHTLTNTPYAVTVNGGTLANLTFAYDPTFTANNVALIDVDLAGHTLTANSDSAITYDNANTTTAILPQGTIVINGSTLATTTDTTLNLPHGSTLSLVSSGSVNSGGAATSLTIDGTLSLAQEDNFVNGGFALAADATLDVHLAPADVDNGDGQLYIATDSSPSLAGALHLTLDGYTPVVGDYFFLLQSYAEETTSSPSDFSGTFNNLNLSDPTNPTYTQDGVTYGISDVPDSTFGSGYAIIATVESIGSPVPEPATLSLLVLAAPLLLLPPAPLLLTRSAPAESIVSTQIGKAGEMR